MDLKLKNNSELTFGNYIPVEYIESTGYPNIDTDISWYMGATSKNKVDCIIQVFDNESSTSGIYETASGARHTYLRCNNGSTSFLATSSLNTGSGINVTIEGKSHIIHTYSSIIINDISTSITGQASSSTNLNMKILPSSGTTIHVRFWKFDVYDNSGNLAAQFIPAVSLEEGHEGEACFYDKTRNIFKYSSSTGSFTASNNILSYITTAYVKDCPNISGINILRSCSNLTRVRLDLGNVSGSLQELLSYSTYGGFTDDYEIPDPDKPKLVGTWTINYYYTRDMFSEAQSSFTGLTITRNNTYDWEYLVNHDLIAIQTIDDSAPNYNPAVAIILQGQSKGTTLVNPLITGKGRWFLTRSDASTITSISTWFKNKTTLTDTNGIVSSDTTSTYDFESFDEFQYFTGITSIGTTMDTAETFSDSSKLESITLPNTITKIYASDQDSRKSVFMNCTSLKEITITSTSYTIESGYNLFKNCSSLISINLSNCTSTTLPTKCFASCSNLEEVILPNITSISTSCFENCTKLNFESLPTTLTTIGVNAFRSCTSLTLTTLPDSVTTISGDVYTSNGAFYGCTNLALTKLPDSLTVIGNRAFAGCTKIKYPSIPIGVTTIGDSAFANGGTGLTITSSDLIDINLPNLTSIGTYAFYYNVLIKSITNLGNITSIKQGVFAGASNLELITYPATMTSFTPAFSQGIKNGAICIILATTPPSLTYNASDWSKVSKIYVGSGESSTTDDQILSDYRAASGWSNLTSKLDTYYNYLHPQS